MPHSGTMTYAVAKKSFMTTLKHYKFTAEGLQTNGYTARWPLGHAALSDCTSQITTTRFFAINVALQEA